MKPRQAVLLILVLLVIDQAIKIYTKTHFYYGEEIKVFSWFRLHFVENPGMAWGLKFGEGDTAKLSLTMVRFVAIVWGSFYINKIIKQQYRKGFIICVAFIYAGALGNLIDSLFYGLIFEQSNPILQNLAKVQPGKGYAGLMFGCVVDMWYFPIIKTTLPSWLPIWGGRNFDFFSPVFNTADVWVSTGAVTLFVFQKRFAKKILETNPYNQIW